MTSAPGVVELDFDELYVLGGLLQMPDAASYALVRDLAVVWPWLKEAERSLEAVPLEAWQQEFIQLFIHRSPRAPCPPYESSYSEELEPGECAARAAQWYLRAGLRPSHMPPDFLGAELRLLAEMLELSEPDSQLVHQLLERLREWVPQFAEALESNTQLEIYRSLARRLKALFG